jgi:4-aminobutyrate aminotransferase-like enzyme
MNRPMNSRAILQQLRDFESRNITYLDPDGTWPIIWERARGVHVWDVTGKKYLDLTAAFGVAAAGHANPAVVHAGQRQMARLLHAMGDVHPHALKASLARELSRITFERWLAPASATAQPPARQRNSPPTRATGKTMFANSGFEAVEAALKTAVLATGKTGVIAFEGAYHGLGYGALNATHREHFRRPFQAQLGRFGYFVPFPRKDDSDPRAALHAMETRLRRIFRQRKIGAVLVEPIQARGGIQVPPPEFLPRLRALCHEHQALLILDEIYTGFGRTGQWFACDHTGTIPDLICLGKALTGGFPLSACVGRADLMDAAWPASTGEAIHTSTFLGHPVGCAMALAQIKEIARRKLPERATVLGAFLLDQLSRLRIPAGQLVLSARGVGLMAGLEVTLPGGEPATQIVLAAIKSLLHQGYLFLPEGEHANLISFTPPLTITQKQLAQAVAALQQTLARRSALPRAA